MNRSTVINMLGVALLLGCSDSNETKIGGDGGVQTGDGSAQSADGGRADGGGVDQDSGAAGGDGSVSLTDAGTDPKLAFEGFYTSADWGDLLMRVVDGHLRGVYPHDQGTVTGEFDGTTFIGWWCEAPSRLPTADAGDVEMRFITDKAGVTTIDGRWRYGSEADGNDWREDWDLTLSPTTVPDPSLVARFENESEFCEKPAL